MHSSNHNMYCTYILFKRHFLSCFMWKPVWHWQLELFADRRNPANPKIWHFQQGIPWIFWSMLMSVPKSGWYIAGVFFWYFDELERNRRTMFNRIILSRSKFWNQSNRIHLRSTDDLHWLLDTHAILSSMSTAVFGSRLISMLYITILYLITIYVGPGLYTVNNHIINHYYNNIIIIPSLLTIFNHF